MDVLLTSVEMDRDYIDHWDMYGTTRTYGRPITVRGTFQCPGEVDIEILRSGRATLVPWESATGANIFPGPNDRVVFDEPTIVENESTFWRKALSVAGFLAWLVGWYVYASCV